MLTHVFLPCKMTSKRIPRKNLQIVGGETLLDRAITRFRAWFPATEIWIATEDREVQRHAGACGCFPYPLTAADVEDRRTLSELFNEFLMTRKPSDRVLCTHLDSPFVFRSELVKAVNDPRPFVGSAFMTFCLQRPDADEWPRLSHQHAADVIRSGTFLVADGRTQPTPADHEIHFSPVSWLSALDVNTPEELRLADLIASRMTLADFDDLQGLET